MSAGSWFLRGLVQMDLGCNVDGDVCKADPNAKPVRKTLESNFAKI
jgi:hypothetical protein